MGNSWGSIIKSPQTVVSIVSAAVIALGTTGIIDAHLAGAIQSLLVAVLSVVTAVTHTTVNAKITARRVSQPATSPEVTP